MCPAYNEILVTRAARRGRASDICWRMPTYSKDARTQWVLCGSARNQPHGSHRDFCCLWEYVCVCLGILALSLFNSILFCIKQNIHPFHARPLPFGKVKPTHPQSLFALLLCPKIFVCRGFGKANFLVWFGDWRDLIGYDPMLYHHIYYLLYKYVYAVRTAQWYETCRWLSYPPPKTHFHAKFRIIYLCAPYVVRRSFWLSIWVRFESIQHIFVHATCARDNR